MTEYQKEQFAERAAIKEFDGKMSRVEAEKSAREELEREDIDRISK